MWQPKYNVSNDMIFALRNLTEVMADLQANNVGNSGLIKLKYDARSISTFASTSIEGNPLPLTDVKQILKNSPARVRDVEKEIINYNNALKYANDLVKAKKFQLSHKEICKIQSIVIDGLMDNPADIGRYRQRAVVIRDPRSVDDIRFMPPNYQDVDRLMTDLLDFINKNIGVIDPILLAGIFHKQHVIIHPFMDGNGRATRIMTSAFMGSIGFDMFEIFSFENFYNKNVSRYFDNVGAFGDYYDIANQLDFSNWLQYFSEGILDEVKRVQKNIAQFEPKSRLEKHHHDILKFIKKHGSIDQQDYARISKRSLASRKNDLKKLVDLGLITSQEQGKATYYI